MAQLNVSTLTKPLIVSEEELLDQILTEYFAGLSVHNWENNEVESYHRNPQEFIRFLQNGNKK